MELTMSDPGAAPPPPEHPEDEVIVRIATERLTVSMGRPAEIVEATMRDELQQRRTSARIQTFVPIFAERAARRRLKRDRGDQPG
jgi:hypothetical protein